MPEKLGTARRQYGYVLVAYPAIKLTEFVWSIGWFSRNEPRWFITGVALLHLECTLPMNSPPGLTRVCFFPNDINRVNNRQTWRRRTLVLLVKYLIKLWQHKRQNQLKKYGVIPNSSVNTEWSWMEPRVLTFLPLHVTTQRQQLLPCGLNHIKARIYGVLIWNRKYMSQYLGVNEE